MTNYYIQNDSVISQIEPQYREFVLKTNHLIVLVDKLFCLQINSQNGVYPTQLKTKSVPVNHKINQFAVTVLKGGLLKEIPYHIYYKKEIFEIVQQIQDLKKIVSGLKDSEININWWGSYLDQLQKGFLKDDWEETEKMFLSTPKDNLFILSIGPIERYHDKLLGTKRFYSAWFFIQTKEVRDQYASIWDKLESLNKQKQHYLLYKPVSNIKPNKLLIGDLIAKGGEVSKMKATGWSRPENPEILKESGSTKLILHDQYLNKIASTNQEVLFNMGNWRYPQAIQNRIKAHLKKYSLLGLLLHEYGHTFIKPSGAVKNLGRFYNLIEEARADINMLYLSRQLETAGLISRETTQNLFLINILLYTNLHREYILNNQRYEYLLSTVLWIYLAQKLSMVQVSDTIICNKVEDAKLNLLITEAQTLLNTISYVAQEENILPLERYAHQLEEFYKEINKKLHLKARSTYAR